MNSLNLSTPTTVQLTIAQLNHIFDQLKLPGATFSPNTKVSLNLNAAQIASLGCSPITIPIPNYNFQSPTVQSIISSTTPDIQINTNKSRINRNFIRRLASQLEISEKDFIEIIKNPSYGNLDELTTYLNEIIGNVNLTREEVREMVVMSLKV